MTKRFSAPVAALAAGILLIVVGLGAGCGSDAPTRAPAPARGTSAPAPTASAGEFNGTDGAWLPLVLAMYERVDPVLELGERRGADPAVRRMAADVRTGHRADVARLRELHAAAGLPTDNPHRTHDMPGMPTAATLDALGAARGDDFDRLFAEALRAHLDQLVRLADGVLTSGTSPRVRDLAEAVRRAAEAHRTRL